MLFPIQVLKAVACFSTMLFPSIFTRWLSATTSMFPSRASHPTKPLLRVNGREEFHIAIFSDLHYGENEDSFGIGQDVDSTRVMNNILSSETPDFVVINGDLITGENTFLQNSTHYVDVIAATLEQHNTRWASTYGNHDSQFNLSREALFAQETKHALSYTQHSPSDVPGVTNYYIPIYPSTSNIPVAILWFFDSQGGFPFQVPPDSAALPDYVEPSVAAWFISEQKVIAAKWGSDLPSLAFVHIPPTAFLTVQQRYLPKAEQESAQFPGLNDDVPLDSEGDGNQDATFMEALASTMGLHSVYSGHDHGDAWCGNWPNSTTGGPHLCFCKHTGYGGYGNWNRSSRNLLLKFSDEGMEVKTWVRMENGEVVQRVDLNGTYGVDKYPLQDGQ
ncbi:putative inactive purple acid phosphatase [Lachnellula suecica]|uniref:Putative inactive purple acid phosphatase n=1 Tax=Lachnellula suecica TaxID=602035 RepID=A0A8T9C8D6_9HELO|nr:putative inactive purple acid phosphatase [Lachnellula suecica]